MRTRLHASPVRRGRMVAHARSGATLESAAAEFALLAQRRARLQRQIELLTRQSDAAVANMRRVELRMQMLSARMCVEPDGPPAVTAPSLPTEAGGTPTTPTPTPARIRRGAVLEY